MTISAVIMSLFLESPIRRQLLHRISEKEGRAEKAGYQSFSCTDGDVTGSGKRDAGSAFKSRGRAGGDKEAV